MDNGLLIEGKEKDLGGFTVVRALPVAKKRSVGHFVFLDHMGPLKITPQTKLDVRPHPHIGLATVTYLFSGVGLHRDSLGSIQEIHPGDINWMTAGRGIVHSERTPKHALTSGAIFNGVQFWVALPKEFEQMDPEFIHYPKNLLPEFSLSEQTKAKLLIGEYLNRKSPVKTYSKLLFMDVQAARNSEFHLDFNVEELGLFVAEGHLTVNGQSLKRHDFFVPNRTQNLKFEMQQDTRMVVIGGDALKEPRHMWWNFVATDKELIKDAARRWENQEMGKVPEETEFIPLPTE